MKTILILGVLACLLAGCTSRPISDSGYRHPYGWRANANPMYRGELTELDVLGTAAQDDASEAAIARALETAALPGIRRGDKLILIQSGAPLPDTALLEEANKYFAVAPFSGVPPEEKAQLPNSLRLRAAQGGYRYLMCAWGILESAQKDREGRIVSWLPIVGPFVPDQRQEMRIRLKAILLDVGTGNWRMIMPDPITESLFSSGFTRETNDQKLVELLKERGYRALIAAALDQGR